MKIDDLARLKEIILNIVKNSTSTGIITHSKPDGDGIGAALALQEILLNYNLNADIILENKLPSNYDFLQVSDKINVYSSELEYETLIILDCHERSRLGGCAPLLDTAEKVVAIDHHLENMAVDSDYYIDPSMVSVGAIIYCMFEKEIGSLPPESALFIAQAVYLSILNDTDNFINANTDAETFRICEGLLKLGLEPGYVTKNFLLNKSALEMKYIGGILNTIEEYCSGRVIFLHSTRKMLTEYGLSSYVNSKILRWVKGLKNVDVIVYFSENSDLNYKLSLRSNIIDVNAIAAEFGGGGHKNASGCSIDGSLPQIEKLVLEEIKKHL
ncbi:bifunctional oligoribonuclease/PAP phosphatase NrnA [Candidatus Cloacimonadota bacterium]